MCARTCRRYISPDVHPGESYAQYYLEHLLISYRIWTLYLTATSSHCSSEPNRLVSWPETTAQSYREERLRSLHEKEGLLEAISRCGTECRKGQCIPLQSHQASGDSHDTDYQYPFEDRCHFLPFGTATLSALRGRRRDSTRSRPADCLPRS